MAKPYILLAPHSFGLPEFYSHIFDAVRDQGFEIRGLHLPSSGLTSREGRPGVLPTMYDDAEYLAREVEQLADDGKDVILIGHSYSGVPVAQCGKGLSKAERQKDGKSGGLVNLAFLSSPVPKLGDHGDSFRTDVKKEHVIEKNADHDGWILQDRPEIAAAVCFSSLPLEEGVEEVKKFAKHSEPSFTNPLTYAAYRDIPCSYLFCEEDLCIPVHVQQGVIDLIESESGRKVDVTRIKADHCPHISSKQEVIDWILSLGAKATQN